MINYLIGGFIIVAIIVTIMNAVNNPNTMDKDDDEFKEID